MVSNNLDSLIPDPLISDRQCARFYHQDIPGMETGELLDELSALRPMLWGLPSDHWLRERVRMLKIELAKRRSSTSQEFKGQSKHSLTGGVKI
jgi:hypothetical protein